LLGILLGGRKVFPAGKQAKVKARDKSLDKKPYGLDNTLLLLFNFTFAF